jgi:hypothetical protein
MPINTQDSGTATLCCKPVVCGFTALRELRYYRTFEGSTAQLMMTTCARPLRNERAGVRMQCGTLNYKLAASHSMPVLHQLNS